MDRDIEYLESCLTFKLNDPTLCVYSRSIAYFMLFCKKMTLEDCINTINGIGDDGFKKLVRKLTNTESDILSIEPRALGTNLVSSRTAGNMQESLNVKQFAIENNTETNNIDEHKFKPITPTIKSNILHSDPEYIWLRWYNHRDDDEAVVGLQESNRESDSVRNFYIVEYRILNNIVIKFPENAKAYKIAMIDKNYEIKPDDMYKYHVGNIREDVVFGALNNFNTYTYERNEDGKFYSMETLVDLENLQFEKNKDVKFLLIVYNPIFVFKITNNIYESYVHKTAVGRFNMQKTSTFSDYLKTTVLLRYYDAFPDQYSLIFLSELKYFNYSPLLFISNFIKFKYCNFYKQYAFDPDTFEKLRICFELIVESVLFLTTKNLTNISPHVQNPLIAFTGERPKTSLNRLKKVNAIYNNQGIRSSQCVNLPMDLGARSTNIEISGSILKTNNECYPFYDMNSLK
ncbi:uncharacterized protein LOC112591497 [Melanaphis sacchari]|uniref:uncharacterized protein LOC112591497 n=1 Tax=Melanaphis sacchari TaxID=742174 RepID=UPI000DC13927|nr:uncharacterized protein LOC112591497 [Melanaphis sacchari]